MSRRQVLFLAGTAIAIAGVVFLLRSSPVVVETARVTRGTLRVTLDEEGETQVHDRYVVTMPVAGHLDRVTLRAGDSVRTGEVVAWVGPAPLDPRTGTQAEARLSAAEDACRVAEAKVTAARAALAQAERGQQRAESLAAAGLLAPEERERAELDRVARRQELQAADFQAQSAKHECEVARAALLGATPGSRSSRVAVRAPVTGKVLRVLEESARVLLAGAPILEIGDPSRIEVRADFLSQQAAQISPGDSAVIEAWGGGTELRARVRTVHPSGFTKVSGLGVEEQRVPVVLDFVDPPDRLGDRFRVEVRVVAWSGQDVLTVPVSALFRAGEAWKVFVVEGGRARKRTVEIGHRGLTDVEVLGGVAEGEVVIRYPGDQVEEGTRVD